MVFPGHKCETAMRYKKMQIARSRADRAIAIEHMRFLLTQSFKANSAAMTPPGNLDEFAHSTVTDLARLRGWSTSVPFTTAT